MSDKVHCLSCGRLEGELLPDKLQCAHCGYTWTYDDEERMSGYLRRVFGRKPVSPPAAVVEEEAEPHDTSPWETIEAPEEIILTGDLTDINGVGKATAKALERIGIFSIADLAEVEDPDAIAYMADNLHGASLETVQDWIAQAKGLLDG
jgi:predicted flap endonuclease-1-like 5' DNA nuclease